MELTPEKIEDALQIAAAVIAIASIVVKLTPTKTDNKILSELIKVLDFLALNKKRAK
jgi:hypothetical protein